MVTQALIYTRDLNHHGPSATAEACGTHILFRYWHYTDIDDHSGPELFMSISTAPYENRMHEQGQLRGCWQGNS